MKTRVMTRGKGFTLIEIMVVLAIVGFLLAVAVVDYHSHYLRTLDQTTSSILASDFEFASSKAKQAGINQPIQFNLNNNSLEIVNSNGSIVKSTPLPPDVQIGVSGFQKGKPPVNGADVCVFPTGEWIAFSPNGSASSSSTAMIAVATDADWRVIYILPTGAVVGPTRSNLLANGGPNFLPMPGGQQVSVNLLNQLQPATSNTDTGSLIQKIKTSWGL